MGGEKEEGGGVEARAQERGKAKNSLEAFQSAPSAAAAPLSAPSATLWLATLAELSLVLASMNCSHDTP